MHIEANKTLIRLSGFSSFIACANFFSLFGFAFAVKMQFTGIALINCSNLIAIKVTLINRISLCYGAICIVYKAYSGYLKMFVIVFSPLFLDRYNIWNINVYNFITLFQFTNV